MNAVEHNLFLQTEVLKSRVKNMSSGSEVMLEKNGTLGRVRVRLYCCGETSKTPWNLAV